MQVFALAVLICSGYVHAGGYGGPVGLVSQAGSSSQSVAGLGSRSVSNTGTLSSGGNGAYVSNTNTDTGYDDSDSTSGMAANSAGVSSGGDQYNGAVVSAGSGPGNIAVNLPSGPDSGSGVQYMNLNTNNGLNNIGPQIQYTIQNILRKFGIDMQQNLMRSSSFQPGQTYVFQTNGAPLDQSQYQYMGNGGMSGFQSQNGAGSQYQGSSGQPVSIAYKVISQPTAAVAFQVSAPGMGASSASFGSGSQSGFGANTISGARSSSFSVPMGSGAQGVVSYTGPQPQVSVSNTYNNDDSNDSGDDSSSADSSSQAGAYGAARVVAPAPVYQAPPPAPVYVAPAPVYRAPAPVYRAPAPVYRAPAPVYQAPAPVYVAPAPAYMPPPAPAYNPPAPAYGGAAQRSKVKYAASNSHKSESNSNVAYEAETEN